MIGIIPNHVSDAIDKQVMKFITENPQQQKNAGILRAALIDAYNHGGVIADIEPVSNPYKLKDDKS